MSFPPRGPLGMPPMPPGMMPQGYGFTPMSMMPMGMMPTPMMRPMNVPSSVSTTSNGTTTTTSPPISKPSKKLVPQEIPKDSKDEKPPVTTVFVGNISDRAPDPMIRQMLLRCGNVLSWKRVQGASGKLQAFGFCEYEDPEATLRCIRLLNEWKITEKKLVVKVDAKTKTLLDEYKKKKKEKENLTPTKEKKEIKEKDEENEDGKDEEKSEDAVNSDLDEFTQREDRVAKAGLDAIMREYAYDLAKEPQEDEQQNHSRRRTNKASWKTQNQADEKKSTTEEKKDKRKESRKKEKEAEAAAANDAGLDDMELEEEKKDLINREIKSFRDAHKICWG